MKIEHALLVMSILLVALSGCIDNDTGPIISTPEPTVIETIIPIETIIEPTPTVQVYNIGQSVSDDNTKMILNGVRYTEVINEARAESGNQFLIINITIENIGNKNLSYNGSQFTMLSFDEQYIYEEDILSSELMTHFNGDNILPGNKTQGELVFQIPEETKDLKLKFEYYPELPGRLKLEFFKLDR